MPLIHIQLTQHYLPFDNAQMNALNCVHHFHSNERINQNWHILHSEIECQQFPPSCSRRKLYSDDELQSEHYQRQLSHIDLDSRHDNLYCEKEEKLNYKFI